MFRLARGSGDSGEAAGTLPLVATPPVWRGSQGLRELVLMAVVKVTPDAAKFSESFFAACFHFGLKNGAH